ncbi:MAG: hypothetical protein Q9208_006490 [Pyrenodesmia sp. 3 TL-2023]
MSLPFVDNHIATIFDRAAATQAGIITYPPREISKPTYLSYKALDALVARKAGLLQRHLSITERKIVLIHFESHLENIVWFWASVRAGCVPALSTPLVRNTRGRLSHFQHLYRLLLDPVVLTSTQLASSDFAENIVLQVVTAEDVERADIPAAVFPMQGQIDHSATVLPNDEAHHNVNGFHSNKNGLVRVTDGLLHGSTKDESNGYTQTFSRSTSRQEPNSMANGHRHDTTHSLNGVAVLMLTSGSTGNAKAVCLTHGQVFAAITGKLYAMPVPQRSALLNWIALDHVASLVEIHLCAMYAGVDQVHVTAAEMLGDPLLFLRLITVHHVSRTFAPNFFLRRLQKALDDASPEDTQDINLNSLHYVASGGEANSVNICARVTEHLIELGSSGSSIIVPGFGMTETCAGAIFNQQSPGVDVEAGRDIAALGTCLPGIEMRLSPVSDANLGETEADTACEKAGALEIRGAMVFDRYFNNEEATQQAFTDDGWFKTGDLATFDSHGHLNLVGRSKELININGVKYLPREIEATINDAWIPGVAQSFVVCFAHRPSSSDTEEVYIVYQHQYVANNSKARMETLHSILHMVALFAGTRPRVLPLPPGRLEKTALGKISRAKVQASLAQGQYYEEEAHNDQMLCSFQKAHCSEPRNKLERTLLTIIAKTLDLHDLQIGIDTLIFDIGISSVELIRLKSLSEKAFGIADIPMVTFLSNMTIRSLASAIERLQTCKYADEYNPVVTLQPKGIKTPLWLIHPGIGEILVFLGLVQYFPDRPIYGLRARGFNPGEKPFGGLDEIVTTYSRALKEQQPSGPYAIAGYSYGSMLAFEISKMLEADGERVQFLASFNLPPHIKERMRMLDWTAGLLHIAHFCQIITEQRSEELVEQLRALPREKQIAQLLAESDQQRCAELALNLESLGTWINVAWSLQQVGWEYDPSGSVACMDVFYCQPLRLVARTREEYRETKLNHWSDFVRDKVEFHEVDGEHYTMIGPEHVPKFQQSLERAMTARGL